MAKVGTAEYDVEISRAKVKAEVDAASRQIEQGLGGSAKKVEGQFSGAVKGAVVGLAAYQGADFLKGSIDAASDLGEAQSKNNIVFGESVDLVNEFGKTAAQSIGQSELQALSAAGTFGNLFRAIGLTDEKSADLSISVTKMASDLASFNNTDVDTALNALRSGLVGETEPLKAFGINLNEARLKQEALNLGLSDGKAPLDAAAKAQAAYSLIMKDGALAIDDFGRTSGSTANQSKILSAEFQDQKAKLGEALMPAYSAGIDVLGAFVGVLSAIPGPAQVALLGIGGLAFAAPKLKAGFDAGSNALDLFRLGLGGVTEKGSGASNALGGFVNRIGGVKSAAVLGAGALGVLAGSFLIVKNQQAEQQAEQEAWVSEMRSMADEAKSTGKTIDDVFKSKALLDWSTENAEFVREFGIDLGDLGQALSAGGEEWETYRASVLAANPNEIAKDATGTSKLVGFLDQAKNALGETRQFADDYKSAQAELGAETDAAADSTSTLAEVVEFDLATAFDKGAGSLVGVNDALADQADLLADAEEQVRSLTDAALGAFDADTAYERQLAAVSRAQSALIVARKEGDPDAIRDAELDLNDAISGQIDARARLAEAEAEARGETIDSTQAAIIQRAELDKARETTDYFSEDLAILAERLNDAAVTRTILLETAEAEAKIARVTSALTAFVIQAAATDIGASFKDAFGIVPGGAARAASRASNTVTINNTQATPEQIAAALRWELRFGGGG